MTCPACFNDQFTQRRLITEILVKRCLRCGLLFSFIERSQPFEAEFARVNDAEFQKAIGTVRDRQAAEVISLVEKYSAAKTVLLDIGCGFGHLLREAQRLGYDVWGIEPDETAVAHARKLIGDDRVHHGAMTDEARPDSSADVISMLDVLEHIPADSLSDFARIIRRKLRPGGLWVIKVPSTEGLYFLIAHQLVRFARPLASGIIKRLWQSEYEFPHTVFFNQQTLRRFLGNHGFDVIEARYIEDVPNGTVVARLLMDDTIPVWQAYLMAPAFYIINSVEKLRGKSDALLMLARRREDSEADSSNLPDTRPSHDTGSRASTC